MPEFGKTTEKSRIRLTSWGNYPVTETLVFSTDEENQARSYVLERSAFIPRGNGRSYGDSALGRNVISLKNFNKFISFDEHSGVLHCEAGVMLSHIVRIFLPGGWFLAVAPGTMLITVGGAIASDVHGKNHHQAGCFSSCIVNFSLLLPDGNPGHLCERPE